MAYKENLEEYVDDFAEMMKMRFAEKRDKYGDEWKNRPVADTAQYQHQAKRFMRWMSGKFDKWSKGEGQIIWLDVACEAMICFVREQEDMRSKIMDQPIHSVVHEE